MLSLTKNSDAQSGAEPLWHSNFRNFERLPDTKVVRTTFFINTAAIAVTLAVMFWLGYREYRIRDLREQIAGAQQQIDSNSRQNQETIRLSRLFATEQAKLAEAQAYLVASISPLEIIAALGQTLPKEISIESIDARLTDATGATFTLRGLVAGTPEQAAGAASAYVDILRAHPRLGTVFAAINQTSQNRDARSGLMVFEIVFKAKSGAKKK